MFVAVVGGGPAGMAAAVSAKKAGADHVVIIERAERLGAYYPSVSIRFWRELLR